MYKKVDTSLDVQKRELDIIKFWEENKIFEKSNELRKDAEIFTFYDGPPTANGMPHIGHIITRVVKDVIPRYKTMKGYNVLRKAGWDTHGLPVELEVEKSLGLNGKDQIETYGVEKFIQKCKESVWKYESEWKSMSERVGYWVDMENPYVTYHNEYIESVWWALKQIWEKDLLYKGHKVVPYCPRCGTALSSHEVAQGYEDVVDLTATAKFKVKNQDNTFLLAWTTTPWTLPSNIALVVNPKEDYVKIFLPEKNEYHILAKALLENNYKKDTVFEIVEEFKGDKLKRTFYEPLFNFYGDLEGEYNYVVADNYVTLTDGTGIVHMAPAFGEEDYRVAKDNGLPFIQLVNPQGHFIKGTGILEGVFIKDADPIILEDLKNRNLLFSSEKFEHNYPFCWRCHTPLMYYARNTWFIKMSAKRDLLVENNNTVNWLPENVKHGRFGNFLENVIDWGVSRERYWGTPLPIWECKNGHFHAIGSIEELKQLSKNCPDNIELHKPYVDEVTITCPECSEEMKRVPEVIDGWFDSGSMPFAQFHYPFENTDLFEANFPADFISEAVDQTRGWFYTLMAINSLLFEQAPYKNVIVLGHVQDENGQKMSKHKGNVTDPWDILNKQGADAIRWYFLNSSAPWLPSRFSESNLDEGQRKFMGTLLNTYAFYVLYANIDNFNPTDYKLDYSILNPMDKWILSKLNSLIALVDDSLENYRLTEPTRAMLDFIDDLSNWYVRRSRERFWAPKMPQEKINAYMVLYTVLVDFIKLAAPFVPFITEDIYSNLVKSVDKNAPESIHLCNYPVSNKDFINKELEENMDLVLKIVVLGRSARNIANIKNRQPIGKMYVNSKSILPNEYLYIIKEELNVKEIIFKEDTSEFTTYSFKPNLPKLGPKYGKILPKISEKLNQLDGNDLMKKLKLGNVSLEIENTEVIISEEDVLAEIIQIENFVAGSDNNITVVLDINLTPELIEEGFVREIISKIQTMRKDINFEILDKIKVHFSGNEKLKNIILNNLDEIKQEVLANEIKEGSELKHSKEWNINGENIIIFVEKY